jgi:hypothetical protein
MSERIARNVVSVTVIAIRIFWALLLLLNVSPPPPKTGERPVPGACKRIAVTRSTEMIICKIVIIISPIISFQLLFANYWTENLMETVYNSGR